MSKPEPEPITVAEACEQLQSNPQIIWSLRVEFFNQQVSGILESHFSRGLRFSVRLPDVDSWRSLGAAVRNSTLPRLEAGIKKAGININRKLPPAAARCLDVFWKEVKNNKSIKYVDLDLMGAPMDHLTGFIQNNNSLMSLTLRSAVSLRQSYALSTAISKRVQLSHVRIHDCNFPHYGSFVQLLEGCASVDKLMVRCKNNPQCNAVTALLRDTANSIRVFNLLLKKVDSEQVMIEITESLVGNTTLQSLTIGNVRSTGQGCFEKLLCDTSSIQSISNSNHTLERIHLHGANKRYELSPFAEKCLALNRNQEKVKVIRDKIRHFYLVCEFDVTPFSSMTVSVLPEAMSQIQAIVQEENKLSAMYRLLRGIPELCNIP